jgi:hypothetical protein
VAFAIPRVSNARSTATSPASICIRPASTTKNPERRSDFLPTLAAVTGADAPKGTIDGQSFLPGVDGELPEARRWIFSWYLPSPGKPGKSFNDPAVVLARTADRIVYTKGSYFTGNGFYDISRRLLDLEADRIDPEESSSEEAATRKMLQKVLDRYAEQGATFPSRK